MRFFATDAIYNLYMTIGLSIIIYMTLWFFISILRKRNDVADLAWGLGFVFCAWIAFFLNPSHSWPSIIAVVFTSIWGLRLAMHIYIRNRKKPEDFRYAKWRREWGKFFVLRSYAQIFLMQGFLLLLIVSPVIIMAGLPNSFDVTAWALAGVSTWIVGFYFESVGDYQLKNFISKPSNKGKIMNQGLWRFTRHPNYFGEVVQWWGLWIILLATNLPLNYRLLGLIGPFTITTLILFVSGIPLLEKKYINNKSYQDYAKRTNKFFPWEPRKITK